MNEIDRIFDRIKSLEKNTKVDPKEIEQILIKFFKNAANIDFLTKKTTMYWGKTIIDLCLRYGYTDFLCFVVETYPKLAEIQDEEGKTFLHIAGFKGLKEVLIKALEIDPKLAKIKNLYNYTF